MATARGTWKSVERRVAAIFEAERTPLSGGNSKMTRSDTLDKYLYVEGKYRQKQAVLTLFRDTAAKAKKEIAPDGDPKTPVVAITEKGNSETFFLIRASDLDILIERSTYFRSRLKQLLRFFRG